MGRNSQLLTRVHTFAESEATIIPYGSDSNRSWFTVRDDRPVALAWGDDTSVGGYQGDLARIKSRLREKGIRTYMLLHDHRCEHAGCRSLSTTKFCPYHMDPHLDVVFCAMTGMEFKG